MKVIRWILSILMIAISVGEISAQEPKELAPTQPYLAPIPDYGHWIVVLKSQAGNQRIPQEIETIKTGDIKQVTLSYSDGTAQRIDQAGVYFLSQSGSRVELFIAHPDAPPYPFFTNGFLLFEAFSPVWFKGVSKQRGIDCFYYQNGSTELWIAVDSMLPVAAKANGIMAYFKFLPAPNSLIVLPPEEQAILEKEQKAYKAFQSVR